MLNGSLSASDSDHLYTIRTALKKKSVSRSRAQKGHATQSSTRMLRKTRQHDGSIYNWLRL